jgi:hypothetical protein
VSSSTDRVNKEVIALALCLPLNKFFRKLND